MFRFAYDLFGNKTPYIRPFPIAAATAIKKGQFVKYTPGTGIASSAGDDFDDPAVGVAMEAHDGSTAGRQSGTEIKISASPSAVYEVQPSTAITATGGSTSTFVDSNLGGVDDLFNGGYIEIVSCAANSALNGKMLKITDYTAATGTIKFDTQIAALAAGDTAYLYPGQLAVGTYAWDTNATFDDIDFETSGGESLILVDADPENKLCYFKLRLHQFGDGPAAI
jgi:hypothetical protein